MAAEIIGSDAQFNEDVDILGKLNLFDSINQVEKFVLNLDSKEKLRITPDSVTFTDSVSALSGNFSGIVTATSGNFLGIVTATKFLNADGSSIKAAVGGGSDNIFHENGQTVTTDYTITSGNKAMSAGPIIIAAGVEVIVPSGSFWTIV